MTLTTLLGQGSEEEESDVIARQARQYLYSWASTGQFMELWFSYKTSGF